MADGQNGDRGLDVLVAVVKLKLYNKGTVDTWTLQSSESARVRTQRHYRVAQSAWVSQGRMGYAHKL